MTQFTQITQKTSQRGSSETLRNESFLDFYWFAGLLDADGGIYVSRQGSVSCEITMHEKEVQTLYFIKKFLGGSVKKRTGKQASRWRLHKKQPIELLLQNLNGKCQTSRIKNQLEKAYQVSNYVMVPSETVTLSNAWLSGFFSGDGCFSINISANFQPSVSISQKEKPILEEIAFLVGGNVYYDQAWDGWVWWMDVRTNPEILNYFKNYSLRNPLKQARLKSLSRFLGYLERELHKDPNSLSRLLNFVNLFQKT